MLAIRHGFDRRSLLMAAFVRPANAGSTIGDSQDADFAVRPFQRNCNSHQAGFRPLIANGHAWRMTAANEKMPRMPTGILQLWRAPSWAEINAAESKENEVRQKP